VSDQIETTSDQGKLFDNLVGVFKAEQWVKPGNSFQVLGLIVNH